MKNFLNIIAQLRNPNGGCPWDLAQNFNTMIPHLLEECYETVDALQNQDWQNLQEELGDLLLQIVFISQLAKEQKLFDFNDVLNGVTNKMIRRHPHVFGEKKAENEKQALDNWNTIKEQEKASSRYKENSILDNIPKAFPALTRAEKIQQRCAKIGFDWESYHGAMNKVKEELAEVQMELNSSHINQSTLQSEVGDLLFACVNLARHLNLPAEETLRQANIKFEKRFRNVEKLAKSQNHQLSQLSLTEMDKLWEIVKRNEK